MFPSVSKDQPILTKIKQKNWDDRFTVQQGIPEYSPLKDKHTASYQKLLNNSTVKKQQTTNIKKQKMTYFEKRVQIISKLKDQYPSYAKNIKQYEDCMVNAKLPNFYIYFSMLSLLKCSDITGVTFAEIKAVKEQTSWYHRISAAVRARDQCLERLRKTIMTIKQLQILAKKAQLHQQVNHLRLLTTNVIDQIKRWRDKLGDIQDKPIYYGKDQENYLIKLLNDNNFIFASPLSQGLNFGQKNDPFLLVPVRRAQGKQASPYVEIVYIQKDISHYQKYMQYLASQKAYDLRTKNQPSPPKPAKNPVEKVYNLQKQSRIQLAPEQNKQQEQDYKLLERNKLRQQRLKKNQERINSIKSIYDTYAKKKYQSQKKIPQTDAQGKRQTIMKIKTKKQEKLSDTEFDGLVKSKMESVKLLAIPGIKNNDKYQKEKLISIKPLDKNMSKSMSKLNKTQDQMIESLRDIQSSLRSKLQVIHKQKDNLNTITQQQQPYTKKNNQDIIKQLKAQILSKLQKESQEKQKIRKKKRQDQEKALEQIKIKLKKQMEQKLQQKKKQKIIEKQQLQKKLKQQQQRLNNQRNLQLQLQIKLNKQRQMRQLQKIRRQTLEKQKKFKQQLEKQQKIRRERQQAIEKQRRQKEKLIQQLKKKQLKEQIQQQLRRQLKAKHNLQASSYNSESLEILKKEKQTQLTKQIEYLKLKEHAQLQQMRKENQLRERMLKLKQQQQEFKRKQVQHMMKKVMQADKEQLERQAQMKRSQLQDNLRSNIKEKLLQQYRNQKLSQLQSIKQKKSIQLQQDIYREKIKEKIQKQMRIEAIQKTKKQLEQRQNKKIQIRSKLQSVRNTYQNTLVIDKEKIEDQVKKDLIEKVIFDKQADRENAKNALRAQFEKQLMASSIPQIYQSRDTHLLKNISYLEDDKHLSSKIQKPTNDKISSQTKNQVKELKSSLTNQELQIYSKKKNKVNQMRQEPSYKLPSKLQNQDQGFSLMKVQSNKQEEEGFDIKIIKKDKEKKQQSVKQYPKKKKKNVSQSQDSEQIQKNRKKKEKEKKKKSKKKIIQTDSDDSEEIQRKKKKKSKLKKKQQDSVDSEEEIISTKRKLQFKTSQDQKKQLIKQKKSQKNEQKPSRQIVHYDAQKKQKQQPAQILIQPITIKPIKQISQNQKFKISLEAIPQEQLDQYLEMHFNKLPIQQINIQLHQREQLYRKLIGELTFCLLIGQYQDKVIGMAYAYHDRNRSDSRKFIIVHIGTYKTQDLKQFLLNITGFIFLKDPTDEIQFHYQFNQQIQQQLNFSNDFNKWFDKFGSVYQKKAGEQGQFERKYVLKRQFNQKCEVVLGGINKNTFRNIFSVYCGVVMSNVDMLQFKQQLKDVTYPQNEISYAIMIAQLFRAYLTPDQADLLKNKVKQFAKLKQLLVLVVMMQKKKIKLDQLKLSEYKNLIELNMKLMSQGKQVIRYTKDSGAQLNRLFYCQLNHGFNLPFNFQTTSLPVEARQNQIRQISYFRLSPLPPFKLHIIKSSLYNAELNILPTENTKYKLFIINASEYQQIKQQNHLDLFMYIRLFLKNVKSHNVAAWKYVWLPEMMDKANYSVRQFKSFLNKDVYCHDSLNISYRQFLPGALIIEPEHRDLVITPPFIVGIMSMTLEQVTEGSPLYARLIQVDALKTLEVQNH